MATTVGMVSLGCSKNRVDSEQILGMLKENGFEITNDESRAEVIIVNTCGFINPAKEESIGTILEMAQHKKGGNCRLLVVTGCLSQRYPKELRGAARGGYILGRKGQGRTCAKDNRGGRRQL